MPNQSIAQSEQSTNAPSNQALTQGITCQASGANTGIAYLTFTDVQCNGDYLLSKKQSIIAQLMQAVSNARGLLSNTDYKPQLKPIMWFLSNDDFGVMVDAVALTDAAILERADEIIAKLSRDCDLLQLEVA